MNYLNDLFISHKSEPNWYQTKVKSKNYSFGISQIGRIRQVFPESFHLRESLLNFKMRAASRGALKSFWYSNLVFNVPQDFSVKIESKLIRTSETIKALLVTVDNKLKWNQQTDKHICRITKIWNGIKIVKRKFESDQLKKDC